jgi:integrase
VPKKARVLTKEQVEKFLVEAPDDYWLLYKVITIFGIFGACRCDELLSLTVKDVEDIEKIYYRHFTEYKEFNNKEIYDHR